MKFTVLPLLALAGSTVAMPAGQPQAAPPGIVDPTILRRTAGKNATHPAKNATVKAQPVFRIQNLDYTLEPLSKKSLQSNLTFDVAYGAKASEASAFTTCTLSWSVRNKKKEYKSAKYVSAYHGRFDREVWTNPTCRSHATTTSAPRSRASHTERLRSRSSTAGRLPTPPRRLTTSASSNSRTSTRPAPRQRLAALRLLSRTMSRAGSALRSLLPLLGTSRLPRRPSRLARRTSSLALLSCSRCLVKMLRSGF